MENYVVTISRQFGSMGRPIARRLAQLLDVSFYDRDAVEERAKREHLPVSIINDLKRAAEDPYFMMKYPLGNGSSDVQYHLFQRQKEIVLELANQGPCVFVGRCADYILEKKENHIRIFIYAPLESRVKVCMERFGMDEKTARMMTMTVDRARQDYHMTYARYMPHDIQHKDILINSQVLGVEKTACLLRDMIQMKIGSAGSREGSGDDEGRKEISIQ